MDSHQQARDAACWHHGVTGTAHCVTPKDQCTNWAVRVGDLTCELAIFEESWSEAGTHRVGGINGAESCCAEHINRWAGADRERAHAEVAQRLMQRREITPRRSAETRPAGNRGAASEPSFFQRGGDALAVCGAMAQLCGSACGDCGIEALTAQGNRKECIKFGVE